MKISEHKSEFDFSVSHCKACNKKVIPKIAKMYQNAFITKMYQNVFITKMYQIAFIAKMYQNAFITKMY